MTDAFSYDPYAPNADPSQPVNTRTAINGQVIIVDYDAAWPEMYEREEARICAALGDRALQVEHIGSTAVCGLPAKPCIDILLAVANSADEPAYVPDLEAAGYVLRIREPEWHEHRCFKGREVNLNLHVWTIGDQEIDRHLRFRDWLRTHSDDRDRYAMTKRRLAAQQWETMQDYADAKDAIVAEIHGWMERDRMTEYPGKLIPLGPIVRLQVQAEKIKSGDGIRERYTPHEHLIPVERLWLDSGGVCGVTVDGDVINDVHHRDHPRSRFRGTNGISLLTSGHYAKMREQFGEHIIDGIAGESILIGFEGVLTLEDLAHGIIIGEGDRAVEINSWSVAHPCAPFSRFAVQFPDDARPDRRLTEALRFLDDGTRGFYGLLDDQPEGREIRVGEMVYLRG